MSDLTPQLPIWLTEKNVTALAKVAQSYWQEIESYLFWWLEQQHSENAQTAILDLLAWERGINRLPDEAVELYGLRVKHAFANATDAGSNVGMEQIFKRLGFGFIQVNERVPGFDWDMVEIAMLEDEFSGKEQLVNEVIKQYGRTCRRYFLSAMATVNTTDAIGLVEYDQEVIG
ncbi:MULTISPECIES: hypothetical protein [unclassified Pseudoalteromonas]|uniref:hypothetical protein n=1 Tax=unclassified Pseudoalteromonas TaxID=194690 RepID=UPI00390C7551|nr:hypothetical protein [Ningiella sp. W23]